MEIITVTDGACIFDTKSSSFTSTLKGDYYVNCSKFDLAETSLK